MIDGLVDAVVIVAALAAVPLLLRLASGGGGRGGRVTFRLRVPLRHRHPGLWWSGVLLGGLALGVLWLADSCGWTS
ncbi:hypothetical protein E1287_42120 [Actinomadura sp. KC06]|uniref:hypothetical protein n=1 Tax=Actinomadura sp. KC06 TaxID=2530369 RepID=UPI001046D0C8|nr:hypothetical protein [Actinomadura sp. KC06]TDD15563.1 hypothetical protein E1287_42120 [Actinomadura sp. KC06]